MNPELIKIYSEVSICNLGCEGVRNEPENGIMGRSYYCPSNPADIQLLLVSKNPGIGPAQERERYKPLDAKERVKSHHEFVRDRFKGNNDLITSKYHQNIIEWVSIILGVKPTHDEVFRRAAMTAMVKCESLEDKTKPMPKETIVSCANMHLIKEIEVIQPKYLLALGGEAFRFLTSKHIRCLHKLPVGELYHPSWTNMKGGVEKYKSEVLPKIRMEFLNAI